MNDLEFAQECCSGSKQAWDEFVDKYSRLIYTYINAILRQKSPDLFTPENTKDIFQDIFLLLSQDNFRKLSSFQAKNGCSLASWLRQITVNLTIDFLRKHKSLASLDEVDEDGFALKDLLADPGVSASQLAGREEKITGLRGCIGELDEDDKFIIEFNIYRRLSLEELRKLLRVSRGAIDMQKARIIQRLKECFKRKGFSLD